MNMGSVFTRFCCATSVFLMVISGAQAQSNEPQSLDEIVVTATKIGRSAQDVEGFTSLLTAEQIDSEDIRSIDDLQKVVPGLTFHQRGNRAYDNVTMRGQSSFDFYGPKTQIYMDGLPVDQATFSQLMPLLTSQVEALYGPQGTLYGRGAIGGVIDVVTAKPGEESGLLFRGGWDELSHYVSLGAGGSLVDDALFADVSGSLVDADGEYRQLGTNIELGDREDRSILGRLRYAPSDSAWDVMFSAGHIKMESTEEQYVPAALLEARSSFPVVNNLQIDSDQLSLVASVDLGNIILKSLTGYQDREMERTVFGTLSPEAQTTISQEIRIISDFGQSKNYAFVAGLYFEDIEFEYQRPGFGLAANQELQDLAAFGEIVWSFAENLDLTLGLRADQHSADAQSSIPGISLSGDDDFSSVTPKLAIGWDASQNMRLYALFSTGFKPGGFTRLVTPGTVSFSYEPEEVVNFEIGGRSSFFNNRLQVAASAYWMENDDFQLFIGVQPNQYLQNIGEARSRGLDLSINLNVPEGLFIHSALSFNEAEFTSYTNPLTPGLDLTGNRLPHAPRFKANLNVGYDVQLPSAMGQLTPSALLSHSSNVYFDETNTVGQNSFNLIDFNLAWESPWDFTLTGYVTNLTDETYTVYGFNAGPGLGQLYQLGRGRNAGIRFQTQF